MESRKVETEKYAFKINTWEMQDEKNLTQCPRNTCRREKREEDIEFLCHSDFICETEEQAHGNIIGGPDRREWQV